MTYSIPTYLAPVASLVVVWILHSWITTSIYNRRYKLPSRVPGLPVFGNSFQMPQTQVEQAPWVQKLAQQYGEMFTLRLGGSDFIFLNSSRVVNDLMEKRAAKYSSRNPMPFVQDLMSGGKRIVLMPYNDKWREIRKVMHSILNSKQMNQFAGYQDLETKQLLWDYLKQPDLWFKANQRYTNAVIMSVVFGRRLLIDDPNLSPLLRQAEEMIKHLQPGSTLVDTFPVLARLPIWMQRWRGEGLRLYDESRRVYGKEVNELRSKMQNGTAHPCFGLDFLNATEKTTMDEDQKFFVLGSLLEAGSDTTRLTMSQVVAAAVLQPDWVMRAREALDRVCGDAQRLPTVEDKPKLPYITAAVKESFRWWPFGPIGVPHMMSQDDEYEGYKFPAGTMVTWNMHAISRSPEEYKDPERFWPERFLNDDLDNVLKGHWAFGTGRRVCPGSNVAETNLWIALARLIYCFDFKAVPGKEFQVENVTWTHIEEPPFAVRITPRSPAHEALIERECSHVSSVVY